MDLARQTALDLLEEVLEKRLPLDDAFARLAEPLNPQDRAFARQLSATTLRRLGQIDALIDQLLKKPLPPAQNVVRNVLRLGIAQLLFLNVPDHAAIDTGVNLLNHARDKRAQGFKGLVNALLRRLTREGAERRSKLDSARLNTPKWLWDRWTKAYGGETARRIAEMHLREPAIDLTLKRGEDIKAWASKLKGEALPNGSIRIRNAGRVEELPGYQSGEWWVQDVAAALPATLFGDVAGHDIVDLCAAPGGKTAQLADRGANVVAVDRSKARLKRLEQNLKRLALTAEVVAADGASYGPGGPADGVLLDAPCSTTGTIRRHPDIAWLKGPRDVKTVVPVQQRLLANAASMLKPGGVLIYCVCSLQPEEGPDQVGWFLNENADFQRDSVADQDIAGMSDLLTEDGDIRTLPFHLADEGGMDGFYIARLRKVK